MVILIKIILHFFFNNYLVNDNKTECESEIVILQLGGDHSKAQ